MFIKFLIVLLEYIDLEWEGTVKCFGGPYRAGPPLATPQHLTI